MGAYVYIALFRGINVGGRNLLPMKELASLLEALGCRNVATYIQSGNAVFQSREDDRDALAGRIGDTIREHHGFAPFLLLLSPDDLQQAIRHNPFPDAQGDPSKLHLGFLGSVPQNPDLDRLEALRSGSERVRLVGKVLYVHAPDGVGRSKLAANAERLLGVPMTDRNWTTVGKLREMVNALSKS